MNPTFKTDNYSLNGIMMFKYRLNFSLLFFLLVFLVQKSGAQNIDLLFPVVDAFSKDLPSYVHLKDGNKFEGRLINFVKENNIIKEIKLELKNEEVGIFKAENISHAYLPIGAKNTKTLNTSKTLLLQQVEKISLDHGKLLKGYAYLLSTQVVSKKGKTEHSVLQVLNPFHCQNIKIMNNPNAKRPPDPFAGLGEATSVYIKKGDEPAFRLKRIAYFKKKAYLFGDCIDFFQKKRTRVNWKNLNKNIRDYTYYCDF